MADITEELVQQILLTGFENPFIRIIAGYAPPEKECRISVSFKGDSFYENDDVSNRVIIRIAQH